MKIPQSQDTQTQQILSVQAAPSPPPTNHPLQTLPIQTTISTIRRWLSIMRHSKSKSSEPESPTSAPMLIVYTFVGVVMLILTAASIRSLYGNYPWSWLRRYRMYTEERRIRRRAREIAMEIRERSRSARWGFNGSEMYPSSVSCCSASERGLMGYHEHMGNVSGLSGVDLEKDTAVTADIQMRVVSKRRSWAAGDGYVEDSTSPRDRAQTLT